MQLTTLSEIDRSLDRVDDGHSASRDDAAHLLAARGPQLERLLGIAARMRDEGLAAAGRAGIITYSKKVFLPITQLCRDRCHYCVFVDTPGGLARREIPTFMSPSEILTIAQTGAGMGCKEALFTLGDRPEDRWPSARKWLAQHGYTSTLEYVGAMAKLVLDETGLIPHLNPGVMSWNEMQHLRPVAGSMGMMLETTAARLWSERGGVHFGSPDKDPALRLRVIEDAGRSHIPFTTGVLLGIGENFAERADALFAIRGLRDRFGHVQETIVQNFRAKPRTAMQNDPDLGLDEYIAAVAVARVVMGPDASVQAPPNLTDLDELDLLLRAGISDWGGVSPLTADHVNPERPWPEIDRLAALTARRGFTLRERLTAYPAYLRQADRWLDDEVRPALESLADPVTLLADESATVRPRSTVAGRQSPARPVDRAMRAALDAAASPDGLSDEQATLLLDARGGDLDDLAALADGVRERSGNEAITYVVNRNIDSSLLADDDAPAGGKALTLAMIGELVEEAVSLGATEICVQGMPAKERGANAYVDIVRAVRRAGPDVSIHAFRPTEIADGARRRGIGVPEFLSELRAAGVTSVPGTGAGVLNDQVRAMLSDGRYPAAAEWVEAIEREHRAGFASTATLIYGHVETSAQIVAHLRAIASIQDRTGGFTEFIPMPFVPADALPSAAAMSPGPDPSMSRAVIAVSRLLLAGRIDHIQAAWTKLGLATTAAVLRGGADDLGGLLLDGEIWPAAGPEAGLALTPADASALAERAGRPIRERLTDYSRLDAALQLSGTSA